MVDTVRTPSVIDMNNLTLVEIAGLSFAYGERQALHNVSLSVGKGEIFGLVGPNGGGKTTLFKILATLLPLNQSAGKENSVAAVRLFGFDIVQEQKKIRQRIGVVFQSPSLDIKLTVLENMLYQGHLYGLTGKPLLERIDLLLNRFSLKDREKELVEKLSGGLKRRVELAKAFIHSPELLLLDEPSTGLDPGMRWEMWRYLIELRDKENVTILFTTHFLDEAKYCDRLAILDKGDVIAQGKPKELEKQMGMEIVEMLAEEPEQLSQSIQADFGKTSIVIGDIIRIECEDGHEFIGKLRDKFSEKIKAITLRQPTLEDFFIKTTGHRFYDEV